MKIVKKIWQLPKIIYLGIGILIVTILMINSTSNTVEISSVDFIGEATLTKNLSFQKTEVGGLSGITYDVKNDLYYAISDDRGQKAPTRFYTFKIDLSKGLLENDDVVPVGVTMLLNQDGKNFLPGTTDTEGIALTNQDTVFISSEGDREKSINPFIQEFSLASGRSMTTLKIPKKFLPDQKAKIGIRNNLAFESLTITPNHQYLFTATENALIQDGSVAKPNIGTLCRILQYNLFTQQPESEFLYQTEPVAPLLDITGKFASGLPDLLALDNQGHFVSLERSFTGLGFAIFLFQVSLADADDIHNIDSLLSTSRNIHPVRKKLLFDLRTLDVALDNLEGLTLGPWLPNGQRSLILVSDNNFNSLQRTQFLAFQLKIEPPILRWFRRMLSFFRW
ncbi:esterase-like activity of phytase family protein [Nostoc sp. FACHB-87]|uniref:esterase-like activity of phytase family protein n=1 Tax=Nostocaceae TaxID=1162 RepID=UPI001689FAFD|nr:MULTISPECIES: esterase-like activity of phytase family protein [Nostocaceae]MBD2457542.1 esterase-like activity of phytase family protein [Nostoc sp. FACHB-87]MBD2478698.1 esterase-like activity of phytase family protein [Anabaena sp. FACHB-83]